MLSKIKKNEQLTASLVYLAFILAALASSLYYFRIDLTESKSYTLSSAAKNLHSEIPEKLRITYFISKSLSSRHPGPASIEDFLKELEVAGRGKISLRLIDPSKDSSEADRLGMEPRQMQVVEKSEQRLALVYSGIAIEYLERSDAIPFVLSSENLEYELIKTIRALVSNKRTVAGILIGDSDKSLQNDYQSLTDALSRYAYDIRELRRGTAIDDDVDILFVLGNGALDRYDSAFLDSFLMRKGRAFFAVKGVNVDPERGLAATALPDGGLLSVLSSYGFDIEKKLLLDASSLTVPFQTARYPGQAGSAYQIQYIRYPHWIVLDRSFAAADHPITANFNGLDLYWASPMKITARAGLSVKDLLKTSHKAWLQTEPFYTSPEDQGMYASQQEETLGQYLVAAAASGKIESAFRFGDMPQKEGAEPLAEPSVKAKEDARIVVISCADFASDLLRMTDSGFNLSFALSAADWLLSADDFVDLGARIAKDYRLDKSMDERLKNFLITFTYVFNLVFVPVLVAAYAIIRALRRDKKEKLCREGKARIQ